MSRWADAFAELSEGAETLDTIRHSDNPPAIVSQSVNSVTLPARAAPLALGVEGNGKRWGEAAAERAAIIESDRNVARDWAEGFAKLNPDCAPADVPQKRWRIFVDDVGQFLDGGWAEKAAALGWGPIDLFGCSRDRPFARIDLAGLCWLINGNRLVALSEGAALIETRTGARQTYRRKPVSDSETAPVWELIQ